MPNNHVKDLVMAAGAKAHIFSCGRPEQFEAIFLGYMAEEIVRKCVEIADREDTDPGDCILTYFGMTR